MIARGIALAVLLALAGCQGPAPAKSGKPSPAGPPPPPMAAEDSQVMCPADVKICADGSTVIQNSRITLSGDNGRRICYQLSALKGNTLDVSLGYGIASTKEVSGNTIRGRIRHKVFQDCSGVENNNVDVRRFSILG